MWKWLNWKTGAAVFAFFVAMGSAAATWDNFGWWKPASIHYVDSKISPVEKRGINTQLDGAYGKRDSAQQRIYEWQDRMDGATDHEKKIMYRDRYREQENIKRALEEQINSLKQELGH